MTQDRYRLRPASRDEVATIRAIEQTAAQRLLATAFAWVADGAASPTEIVMAAIDRGSLLVAHFAGQPVAFPQATMVDGMQRDS